MWNLKTDVRQENWVHVLYSPLNVENNWGVTDDVMFAYAHEKINNLLSVSSSSSFFFFYDFNLNT